MTDRDDRLWQIALRSLDEAAKRGSSRSAGGAAMLRQMQSREIDDSALLLEVAEITALGLGRQAVGIVARRHGHTVVEVGRIERRLRRKDNARSGLPSVLYRPNGI
jgi:hypothetical protein